MIFFKVDVKIDGGWLPYLSSVVYLGTVITDKGLLSSDVILKRKTRTKMCQLNLQILEQNLERH